MLNELVQEIIAWQDSVFTEATPLSAAEHLRREVRELIFDLKMGNLENAESEIADCFLLIVAVAHLSGVDLEIAADAKLTINKARIWGKPDADGVVEHIRSYLPENFRILVSKLEEGENNDGTLQVD